MEDGKRYNTDARNAPFFIVACGRSGSSLLSRMLNAHPRLAVPNETHLFDNYYRLLSNYGDLGVARNRERLVDDILSTARMREWSPKVDREQVLSSIKVPSFSGIADAILRSWSEMQNKSRWGEKTPQHLSYWREILACFPDAKFIHIVRDGRDVALSWIRAPFGPKTVYTAAKRWVQDLAQADDLKASVPEQTFLEIRYEDLLQNPEQVLAEICRYLDEEVTGEIFDFYRNPVPYKTDEINLSNLRKPLMSDNKYKWRTEMTVKDLGVFEVIAGDRLSQYGYELALANPAFSRTDELYYRFVESPPRKLLAMIRNRRGQVNALDQVKLKARLLMTDRLRR